MRKIAVMIMLISTVSLSAALAQKCVEKKRNTLASHETVTIFKGVKVKKCNCLTSLCPDKCGHGGPIATFEIIKYISYKKNGQYGDDRTSTHAFMLKDHEVAPEIIKVVETIMDGDHVLLSWNHDYVTCEWEGGGSSSGPERPITKLEKISMEDAEKIQETKVD